MTNLPDTIHNPDITDISDFWVEPVIVKGGRPDYVPRVVSHFVVLYK